MFPSAVTVGQQAGKFVLNGAVLASEAVKALRSGTLSVNAEAQRSLAKGAGKGSTKDLIESEKVDKTPRMKSIISFYKRVMDNVEAGQSNEGFFGAVQLAVPEGYTGAKVKWVAVPDALKEQCGSLMIFLDGLRSMRVGTLLANPGLNEIAVHIVDGQGRLVGFYSLAKAIADDVEKQKRLVQKLEKARDEGLAAERADLVELERQKARVDRFLSSTHVPFVLYVRDIKPDGTVVGLSLEAERRLYIEGNALNSQASKEELIKYEQYSPVVIELQNMRSEPQYEWMSADFIEEDSKSIGALSSKVFTLSALVQAFSFSIVGHNQPLKRVDGEMFDQVKARAEFARAYWERVSKLFGGVWTSPTIVSPGKRVEYMKERRAEQNVAFTGIFLLALGRLGHRLGLEADWDPESAVLDKLVSVGPKVVDYVARDGSGPEGYNPLWTDALMKPATDKEGKRKYVFNNVNDSIVKTYRVLCERLGIEPDVGETADEAELEPDGAEVG